MPRLRFWARLLLAALVFAALLPVTRARLAYWASELALGLGERAGFEVFRLSGRVAFGPDGPFYNAPAWANAAYHYGTALLLLLPPFFFALFLFHLLSRWRPLPRDGHTRCGRCNHILKGLTAPRCPECGVAI